MLKIGSMKEAYDLYHEAELPKIFSYDGMIFERRFSNVWRRMQSVNSDDMVVFSNNFSGMYWHSPFRKDFNFTYYSMGDFEEKCEDMMKRLIAIILHHQGVKTNVFVGSFFTNSAVDLIALHKIVETGSQDFRELVEYAHREGITRFIKLMEEYRSINITRET